MFLPPIGTKKAARSQLTTHLSGIGTPSQGLCAQTLSVYAPLEVVGIREKLRELIVFIAPDAETWPLSRRQGRFQTLQIGPAIATDGDRVRALIAGAIDKQPTHTHVAHLAEGDL